MIAAARGPDHEYAIKQIDSLIVLYTAWHEAEPDKGYDAKAAAWRAKDPSAAPDRSVPNADGE